MPFSAEEIRGKDFLLTLRGYDKEEVRAFLEAVASDYKALADTARAGEDVPNDAYEQLGREVGSVIQAAKQSASDMKRQAEGDAAELRMRADKEAARIRDAATNAAKRLRDEVDRYAVEIRAGAEKEAADKIKDSHRRLERLQTTEAKVRQRLYSLEAMIQNLRQELDVQEAAGDMVEINSQTATSADNEDAPEKVTPAASTEAADPGLDANASRKVEAGG
ncbi:MAG TPA: DivIVA domain-containing protein [Actinomycetota bacterium]|nr:DivIVA domain-containing protein [Actinomycetota bacterium]